MESTFGTYCLDVSVCKHSEDRELNEFREFRNCARTLFGVSTKLFNFTKFPNNFEFSFTPLWLGAGHCGRAGESQPRALGAIENDLRGRCIAMK